MSVDGVGVVGGAADGVDSREAVPVLLGGGAGKVGGGHFYFFRRSRVRVGILE